VPLLVPIARAVKEGQYQALSPDNNIPWASKASFAKYLAYVKEALRGSHFLSLAITSSFTFRKITFT